MCDGFCSARREYVVYTLPADNSLNLNIQNFISVYPFQVEKKLTVPHIVRHFTVHTWTMLSQNVIIVDVLFPDFSFHSMEQVPLGMLPLLVSVSPKSPFWKVDFCFNAQVVRLFFHRMYALHWHLSTLLDVYTRFFSITSSTQYFCSKIPERNCQPLRISWNHINSFELTL